MLHNAPLFVKMLITRIIYCNCARLSVSKIVENLLKKQLKTFFVGKCGGFQEFFVPLHPI